MKVLNIIAGAFSTTIGIISIIIGLEKGFDLLNYIFIGGCLFFGITNLTVGACSDD